MRLWAVPENPIGLHAGRPDHGRHQARRLRGARRGAGDARGGRPALRTSATGTEKLLFALAGAEYLRAEDGGYGLMPVSRKWLLRESPHSLADKLLLQFHEWDWLERAEDYVRTGEPLELHSMTEDEHWDLYQRGMRAMANAFAGEAVRRMPLPKDPKDMLEFYFALPSQSGTWAMEEISDWQHQAGLSPGRPIRLRTAPGVGTRRPSNRASARSRVSPRGSRRSCFRVFGGGS